MLRSAILLQPAFQGPIAIRGFAIEGDLVLTYLRLPESLLIEDCEIDGALILDGSRVGELVLNKSRCSNISAKRSNFTGSVVAEYLTATQMDLTSATMEGDVRIPFARLYGSDDGPSISLDGASVKGSVDAQSLHTSAGFSLRNARIGGSLKLDGSFLLSGNSRSVDATGSDIHGDVVLQTAKMNGAFVANRLHASGQLFAEGIEAELVIMDGARVEGGLSMKGARIRAGFKALGADFGRQFDATSSVLGETTGIALNLDGANVVGALLISDSVITGAISLARINVTGPLVAQRTQVNSDSGIALCLDGATVGGIAMSECDITGQVTATEMTCRTSAELSGSQVRAPGACVIQFEGSVIAGDLEISGTTTEGKVSLAGTTIGGSLIGTGCVIKHEGGPCLELDAARVTRDISLSNSSFGTSVSAHSISCGGRFDICSSNIEGRNAWALSLYGARIEQGLDIRELETVSPIDAQRSIVTGGMVLGATRIAVPDAAALVLAQTKIDTLDLRLESPALTLDLRGCNIGAILVSESFAEWYPLWDATGFTVEDIRGVGSGSLRHHVTWLDGTKGVKFSTQPWHELADWFERVGEPSAAKRLRFAAAQRLTSAMPPWTRPARWLYLVSAGYGYYPLIAVFWFVILWLGTFLLVQGSLAAFHPTTALPVGAKAAVASAMTACLDLGGYPCFDPIAYTNGVVSPVGWLHPYPWSPTDAAFAYVMWAGSAARTAGWALSAVLLAGISGLLKKG